MGEFVWPIRVYYEDTDAGGVVFYANYLKFMERARTEWLRSLGIEQDRLIEEHDVLFAVREALIRYRQPARFNEELSVSACIDKVGRASLSFSQTISRTADDAVLSTGRIDVACLRASSFRPLPIPDFIRVILPR